MQLALPPAKLPSTDTPTAGVYPDTGTQGWTTLRNMPGKMRVRGYLYTTFVCAVLGLSQLFQNPQNPQSVILPKALACPNLQTLLPLLGSACCVDPTVMSPSLFTLAHLHNAQHVLDSGSCSLPVHCTGHHVLDAGLCMPAGVACSIVLRRRPCYTHIYMERGTGNKHNIANDALKNGI